MAKRQIGVRPTQYGQVGGPYLNVTFPIAASELFILLSGQFVIVDSNNDIKQANATDTNIIGWALVGDNYTSSSTAGLSETPVNIALGSIYEMPLLVAYTEAQLLAMLWETCDIIISGDGQYANLAASDIDVLEIVDYRYYGAAIGEQTVIVRLYLPNITAKGGVA